MLQDTPYENMSFVVVFANFTPNDWRSMYAHAQKKNYIGAFSYKYDHAIFNGEL